MPKKKKIKFKHNKRKITLEQQWKQLKLEQKILHDLVNEIKLGENEHLYSTIFPKLRALICEDGTWTMNPLLQRVMKSYNYQLKFYTSNVVKTDDTIVKIILSKTWRYIPLGYFNVRVNLTEYLDMPLFYNSAEYRFISRNEALRIIADSEGSHFDDEINKFSDELESTKSDFNGVTISQKELFMWDLYTLVDWHINMLDIEFQSNEIIKKHPVLPNLGMKQKEIQRIGNYYDGLLQNSLIAVSHQGLRVCSSCKSHFIKLNDTTLECKKCKKKIEL